MKKKSVPAVLNSERKGFTQAAAAESATACTRAVRAVDGRDHGEGAEAISNAPRQDEVEAVFEGTPPSNTVPSNDNLDKFKALRFGVDSLYLSYHGQLSDEWNIKLDELKDNAQSEDIERRALAQVSIANHLFEVRDKGAQRFPYVLIDNCFFIKIKSQKSKTLPMAHVQISSEYLSAVGVDAAEKNLRIVINTLGLVEGEATVSRLDLYLDFVTSNDLNEIDYYHWSTEANIMAKYFDARTDSVFTGWAIGMGGNIAARLYEKVEEINFKSGKYYLFDLWEANGWNRNQGVWRLEFQILKPVLKEFNLITLSDLNSLQDEIWHYLTQKWLRLVTPNLNDSKRDRWPNQDLWDDISAIYSLPSYHIPLKRFRPARLPPDERLFVHGLGGFTSFMASRGIQDFGEGVGEFLHQATEFHSVREVPLQAVTFRH
jgi:hypothetical protein